VTIDREQLLAIASAERQRLGRMVQFAEPETWEQPSAADGWWNRDVMAHLGALDTAAAQLFAGDPAEEMDAYLEANPGSALEPDGFNAWSVARRSGQDTRTVLETWGRAAEALLAYATELGDGDWRDARYRWFAGDIAPRFLLQSQIVEWFLHGEDMRATNGVRDGWQMQWQHWSVHLTIDLAVRMLPWQLSNAGHDLPGLSVLVELEGAGEGTWHWALSPEEVAAPGREADAVIKGRAPQCALVVGRRLDADQALDAGAVVLGGDVDLAELVLRTAKPYV
jgi:uncharacterized protein (TIGR03083 family)